MNNLKILVNDKDSLIKDLIFQLKQKDIHLESFLNKLPRGRAPKY